MFANVVGYGTRLHSNPKLLGLTLQRDYFSPLYISDRHQNNQWPHLSHSIRLGIR